MLQLKSIDAFLYLTDKLLQLYYKDNNFSIILEFAPEIVSNQEVIEKTKYEEMIRRFLIDNEISEKHVAIILSKNLLFLKELIANDEHNVDEEAKKFLSEIPFSLEDITEIEYKKDDGLYLIATNRSLYEIIHKVINESKGKVEYIVPATFIFPDDVVDLTPEQAKQVFSVSDSMSKADFLTLTKLNAEVDTPPATTTENLPSDTNNSESGALSKLSKIIGDNLPKIKKISIGLAFLVLIAVIIFLLVN